MSGRLRRFAWRHWWAAWMQTLAANHRDPSVVAVMQLSGATRLVVVAGLVALGAVGWAQTRFWRHYLFDNYYVEPRWAIWAVLGIMAIGVAAWVAMGFRPMTQQTNKTLP